MPSEIDKKFDKYAEFIVMNKSLAGLDLKYDFVEKEVEENAGILKNPGIYEICHWSRQELSINSRL